MAEVRIFPEVKAGVPAWMGSVGVKPGEWLSMTKAQLRTMQRPDKPLKVQVWATGMLHTAAYQGEAAFTMRHGKRVPLTPGDIIKELWGVAKEFYSAQRAAGATDAQIKGLREDKYHLRRALEELEDEGVCARLTHEGVPLKDVPPEKRQQLHGRIRLLFWLKPAAAGEATVEREWRRQIARLEEPEEGAKIWPLRTRIRLITQLLDFPKPGKTEIADASYIERVECALAAAKAAFKGAMEGLLGKGATGRPLEGFTEKPLDGATGWTAFERKDERNGSAPSCSPDLYKEVAAAAVVVESAAAPPPPPLPSPESQTPNTNAFLAREMGMYGFPVDRHLATRLGKYLPLEKVAEFCKFLRWKNAQRPQAIAPGLYPTIASEFIQDYDGRCPSDAPVKRGVDGRTPEERKQIIEIALAEERSRKHAGVKSNSR